MRQNKCFPNHLKTKLFSEVDRAMKSGVQEIIIRVCGRRSHGRNLVVMHQVGDRVLFFDPLLNPTLSYDADLGPANVELPADGVLPARRYEGNGMHSMSRRALQDLFYDAKGYGLLPIAFRWAM
jgi:hypothetical protein